jgi:hypothetical protein
MGVKELIVPGESLGGIFIGEQVEHVIHRLSDCYDIGVRANSICMNGGLVTAYHDEDGMILSLSCNSDFKGGFSTKLWPGMTVEDVLNNTRSQIAWSGFLQVDGIKGIGLSLPDALDDFEKITDIFDGAYVFEELWVYK